jgi:hypothetical protein
MRHDKVQLHLPHLHVTTHIFTKDILWVLGAFFSPQAFVKDYVVSTWFRFFLAKPIATSNVDLHNEAPHVVMLWYIAQGDLLWTYVPDL